MMSENTSTKIVDSVIIASCALPQSVLLFTAWWYKVVSATSIAGWFCGSRGAVGALGRRFQLQFVPRVEVRVAGIPAAHRAPDWRRGARGRPYATVDKSRALSWPCWAWAALTAYPHTVQTAGVLTKPGGGGSLPAACATVAAASWCAVPVSP